MLHKVLGGRKICIFGKNDAELLVAYYGLSLGNAKVSAFIYHNRKKIKASALDIIDSRHYAFQSDKYYIVVADSEDYEKVREVLIAIGYEPIKDFVQFKPVPYANIWRDDLIAVPR